MEIRDYMDADKANPIKPVQITEINTTIENQPGESETLGTEAGILLTAAIAVIFEKYEICLIKY